MPKKPLQATIDRLTSILEEKGCELIEIKPGRIVFFICSCGLTTSSNTSNLLRKGKGAWKGGCNGCSNMKRGNVNPFDKVKAIAAESGIDLDYQYYKNDETLLNFICKHCNRPSELNLKSIRRGRLCNNKTCSTERSKKTLERKHGPGIRNPGQIPESKVKAKATNMRKLGVPHHMQDEKTRVKAFITNLSRYGYGYSFHSDESRIKGQLTCLLKYGKKFPLQVKSIMENIKQQCRNRLGVDYPFQSPAFMKEFILTEKTKQKRRDTMVERYGTEYPVQNAEICRRMIESSFSIKFFEFPSGRVEPCQGYEPLCLAYLSHIYEEDDIMVGWNEDIGSISYPNPKRDGKLSKYFPDGYILSENIVIETKSTYTLGINYEETQAKIKKVIELGYNIALFLFDEYGLIYRAYYETNGDITFSPPTWLEKSDTIVLRKPNKKPKFGQFTMLIPEYFDLDTEIIYKNGHITGRVKRDNTSHIQFEYC